MLDLSALNEQQRRAVTFSGNNAVLVAGAGSGKTRTLVYRTAYILEQGINPRNIMVTTFTKSASEEMIERVGNLVGDGISSSLEIGTSHSIFFRMYRKMYTKTHYSKSTPMLAMGGECFNIIKSGLIRLKLIDTLKTSPAMQNISYWKNEGLSPKEVEKMLAKRVEELLIERKGSLSPMDGKNVKIWTAQLAIYRHYHEELDRRNKIDFDDMLYKTYHMLLKNKDELRRLQKKFQYIMVDEAQDLNLIQYKLTELLSADNKNAMLIGDDYQCQPAGTIVETVDGPKKIEELKINDSVVSYSKQGSYLVGSRKPSDFVKAIQSRFYQGRLLTIKAGERATRCTPEHDFLVKFNKSNTDISVTYLMRQGNRFRVGWCKLFYNTGAVHLYQRFRNERADAVWIVSVHESRQDASLEESYISAKFGLPLIMFHPVQENQYYTKYGIDYVFDKLGDLSSRASKCLSAYGRDINYPFYDKSQPANKHGATVYKIASCNMIPKIMSVPVQISGRDIAWTPITISSEDYEGYVFSLAVSGNRTYVADGIVTHNCIYGFRGSKVKFLQDYVKNHSPDLIKLEENYRSTGLIVRHSNLLIKQNKIQLEKTVMTSNKEGKPIEIMVSESNLHETLKLPDLIEYLLERGYRYSDIAILYRVNAQALLPAFKFIEKKIPHKIYSKESIYDANEIKEVLTYIKLFMKPHEVTPKDFIHIMNKPSRYLPSAFGDALKAYCRNNDASVMEAIGDESWLRGVAHPQAFRDLQNLRTLIFNRFTYYVESAKPCFGDQVTWIYESTGYKEYHAQHADSDTAKNGDSDGEMVAEVFVQLLQNFESLEELEEFIDTIKDSDASPKTDHVRMMTIHTSKGREFPVVIILGACSRLYPHHANDDLEEERRVMYVGITRPKKRLFISAIAGKYGRYQVGPTRYITDMGLNVNEPFNV